MWLRIGVIPTCLCYYLVRGLVVMGMLAIVEHGVMAADVLKCSLGEREVFAHTNEFLDEAVRPKVSDEMG
jgi:hypothetical protein